MNIKILPPEIQEWEFNNPSNRPQLSRRDYLNCDRKVAKVSGDNPDKLKFWQIKLRLKFCPKNFDNEILEGFYWKGLLKEEVLKNIEIVKN